MKQTVVTIIFTLPILVFALFWPKTVLAIDAPTLSSPTNSSTVSSSTLTWQAPSGTLATSDPYRVQVDDNADFSSPTKDYYTTNTHYSPSLNNGTWYWRVKAKDSNGKWSDWSSTWSFTLGTTTNPNPSPGNSPSPTSSPNPSPSSTPSQFMTISAPPSSIHYNESFSVQITLQNFPSNTQYFLKGAFVKPGSSNYFGQTSISGNWIKNNQSYPSQLSVTTDQTGNWTGTLTAKPDTDDSGFTGSATYIFKIARYSSTGSGPIWSDQSTISIVDAPAANPSPDSTSITETDPTDPSPSPTAPPTTPTNDNSTRQLYTPVDKVFVLPNLSSQSASVAGIATVSATANSAPNTPIWYIIGGGLCLVLAGLIFYLSRNSDKLNLEKIYNFIKQKLDYALPHQHS